MTPKDEDVSFHRDGSFHMLMSRSTPAVGGRGKGFPGIGPLPTFQPLPSALEVECPWVCHLAFRHVMASLH